MAEQTITSAPVNAPDVLLNAPLSRQVDVELETKILEPVSHRYDSATGGRTTYILPASGVLDAPNCALQWELVSSTGDGDLTYPFWAGGLAMIETITCRCGGQILSQVENAHRYATIKNNFKSQAEKEGILDVRHGSMNQIRNRPSNCELTTGAGTRGFHQLYNVEADQVAEFGYNYSNAIAHTQQPSKSLSNTAGRSFECVVRLSDVFKFFESNRLPLLAMAQVEIEVIWAKCGDPNITAANVVDSAVIDRPVAATAGARASTGVCTMTANPTLLCDYIHYDDAEKQQIFNAINSGGGMAMNFTEVLMTRGINPASAVSVAAGTDQYELVESNHIIGMAMKEVKKIYVWKEYDLLSPDGAAEIDGNYNQVYTHRSVTDNTYKSQCIPGEAYNFIINNQRIYSKKVDNVALQHNYLSQCNDMGWNCTETHYDTGNYNANKCAELLDTSWSEGVATQNINAGRSKPYLTGSQHVIGLNLDKMNSAGNQVGNGMRISSAPIEFQYSRVAIGVNGSAANSQRCPVNLTFFIEYRRSLVIRPLGIDVSDA